MKPISLLRFDALGGYARDLGPSFMARRFGISSMLASASSEYHPRSHRNDFGGVVFGPIGGFGSVGLLGPVL